MLPEVESKLRERVTDAGGYIKFSGYNCYDLDDNYCEGWDGESRRCACGNRRVYWALVWGVEKDSDNPDDYYAEAY